jgi:hypothetical protein
MSTPTNIDDALAFANLLAERLRSALTDVDAVRGCVMRLELLAKKFPETRFCKGCVLPIVDETANQFCADRYSATPYDVYRALRCEGYETLNRYYDVTAGRTGFASYAAYRPDCKQGTGRPSRPSPDYCIRLNSKGPLRLLGETKFSLKPVSTAKLQAELLHDLRYYLSIDSEPNSDWGHDFGFGVGYCAAGDGDRTVQVIRDYWEAERILLMIFGQRARTRCPMMRRH